MDGNRPDTTGLEPGIVFENNFLNGFILISLDVVAERIWREACRFRYWDGLTVKGIGTFHGEEYQGLIREAGGDVGIRRQDLKATKVVVDLAAIRHNIREILRLHPEAGVISVVKADAYGHGMVPVATAALSAGAGMLAVAFVEEGVALREAGITAPVLILGATPDDGDDEVVRYDLTQTVYDPEGVHALDAAAAHQRKKAKAHIKIETGMHRLGARPGPEMEHLLDALDEAQHIHLVGVFSHLANAEQPGGAYNRHQDTLFRAGLAQIAARGYTGLDTHLANSALALERDPTPYGWLRLGIVQYGISPSGEAALHTLRPALRWLTQVAYIKPVAAGEAIGYGCTFTAPKNMLVATLPVGYADGYRRSLSGKGHVLIHGYKAPIVGRICMDQCMCDVTDIPGVARLDEVILLGRDGEGSISADLMAEWMDTNSYEVVTCIGKRVPRLYTDESRES